MVVTRRSAALLEQDCGRPLAAVQTGFNASNLATVRVSLPESRYRNPHDINTFYAAVQERIEAIPGEIELEAEVIRRRYAEPAARLFPVALTFLVPESLAGG